MRRESAQHAEDYITKLKQNLVTSVRKENLSSAFINRAHSNSYQISGMYVDNSMYAQQKKLIQIKREKEKAESHLIKH